MSAAGRCVAAPEIPLVPGDAEAQTRLARYGPNELVAEPPVPAWRRFLAQFQDVLVILLLIATAISVGLWLYERDTALPYEGLAIFAIVLLNGLLGYVQEARAEQAVAALRAMSAAEASAIRDGQRQAIPAAQLVPGDIILLEEGDTIPADARLIQSIALQTAEASMTGESLPGEQRTPWQRVWQVRIPANGETEVTATFLTDF